MEKEEIKAVIVILLLILVATGLNLRVSLRKARDVQRKGDIREYSRFLDNFQDEYGVIPASEEGKIVACNVQFDELGVPHFDPCEWDPSDPHDSRGVRYYYLSNSKRYQVFAALEGEDEAEYDPKIVARNLPCGNRICNFGLSRDVPLDKSIEEYENELRQKEL